MPDHQEVFFNDGTMLTVELCEMLPLPDDEALRAHFVEMVVQSGGGEESMQLDQGVIHGTYQMRTSHVQLAMSLLRLGQVRTDVVVSLAGPCVQPPLLRGVVQSLRVVDEGLFV